MKQGFDWETKVSRDHPSVDPSHRVLGLFPIKSRCSPNQIDRAAVSADRGETTALQSENYYSDANGNEMTNDE